VPKELVDTKEGAEIHGRSDSVAAKHSDCMATDQQTYATDQQTYTTDQQTDATNQQARASKKLGSMLYDSEFPPDFDVFDHLHSKPKTFSQFLNFQLAAEQWPSPPQKSK